MIFQSESDIFLNEILNETLICTYSSLTCWHKGNDIFFEMYSWGKIFNNQNEIRYKNLLPIEMSQEFHNHPT